MTDPISPLTLEFLRWLAARPRTYAEVMEAWRTSCPRLSVWEDALADGLVELEDMSEQARVTLSARGNALVATADGSRFDSR